MKQGKKLKRSTKFIIFCLLIIWSPLILFGTFLFAGHGFEPIIAALHLREMNKLGEPLAIGEVWQEEPFSFVLEDVLEVPEEEWQAEIPPILYEHHGEQPGKAYMLQFSFRPGMDLALSSEYDIYACGYDATGNRIACPLPTNKQNMLTAQDHEYMFLTLGETSYVDVVVRIPYGEQRYYKKCYLFSW